MKVSKLFWIGITISFSVVISVLGLLYLQDISFNQASLKFTVMFENVQGLNDGDKVSMLGKRIGKVSSAKIMGNRIAVEVSIDQNFSFNIPIDSRIEVKSDGLMGAKFVSIDPGLNTNKSIKDGDVVEGTRELDFTEITPGIMPITQDLAVFTRRLKALLGENQKDDIRNTLSNVESLTNELDSILQDIHSFVNDEDRKNIEEFFSNLNSASKSIKDLSSDKIANILNDIHGLTSNNKDEIEAIIKNFSSSSKSLKDILDEVEKGNGSLGKLVKGDGLFDNMNGFITDLRNIIQDFNENREEYIKDYIRASKKVKREK